MWRHSICTIDRPILIAQEGFFTDALRMAFIHWGYTPESIKQFTSAEAKKIPERLLEIGANAVIVVRVFTGGGEEVARGLLTSVRTAMLDCAHCPFVLLALDEQLPSILKSPGCHTMVLPRDSASLQHIHSLQSISDQECEQFIAEYGKPTILEKLIMDGYQLFHNFPKQSLCLQYAGDYKSLKELGLAFCFCTRRSLESLKFEAHMIGLSLTETWPETEEFSECLTELDQLFSVTSENNFNQTIKMARDKRQLGIRICKSLESRIMKKGGF